MRKTKKTSNFREREVVAGANRTIQVGLKGTIALMLKTQFGLGILSIPDALNTLGLIPGVLCVLAIATVTTWSNYMIGVFKQRHREVYGIDDAGGLMFGRVGREFFGTGICICRLPLHSWNTMT